jgi:hypothetical protein
MLVVQQADNNSDPDMEDNGSSCRRRLVGWQDRCPLLVGKLQRNGASIRLDCGRLSPYSNGVIQR